MRCGIIFVIVLNIKHIFLYISLPYFIYLLRVYCYPNFHEFGKGTKRLALLGISTITVFMISFGPFIYYNQMDIVIKRLFPFKRGLFHAYWAPNFWSLYAFVDRVLIRIIPTFSTITSSATRGIVGDTEFGILPKIYPSYTMALTLIFQIVINLSSF